MAERGTIILKNVKIAFPVLFNPEVSDEGKKTYSVTLLMDDDANFKQVAALAVKTAKGKFGDKVDLKRLNLSLNKCEVPTSAGSIPSEDWGFDTEYYIRAKSKFAPGLVDKKLQDIIDEDAIYGGCIVNVEIGAYAYEYKGKKGVSFTLYNMQLLEAGERMGGERKSAADIFDSVGGDDSDSSSADAEDEYAGLF